MAGISKKKIKTKKGESIKYTITYRDIKGKQHTSGSYRTKQEALKDLPKFQKLRLDNKNLEIGQAVDLYIDEVKKRGRAKKTIEFYENHRDNALKPYINLKYSKLIKSDWQNILYEIRDNNTPQTANGVHRTLRAVFNFLKDEGVISENTFKRVKPVEVIQKEFNHFEPDEILNLLDICKKNFPKHYALFFAFVGTGMREGELFGLLKENVDFEKNCIKVCTQYTGEEFKTYTKTKKNRMVFLFPTLAQVLKEHIENDKTESKLVFHNEKGNFLHLSNFRQRFWHKLLKAAGYPEDYARIHDLRGSYSDLAPTLGLSITFSKDQLGHTTEATTLKNYMKTNNTMRKEGIKKLEEVFSKCEPNVSQKEKQPQSNIIYFPKNTSRA